MRTTVDINDDLLTELKRVAADTRRSLKDLIEDAIRASLAQGKAPREAPAAQHLITFRGRGVQRGANLDSMRELLDIMDSSS
jgi:hypothetical protein